MLTRHRRRSYMIGEPERTRPRMLARIVIAVLALIIVWYLATKVFSLFEYSVSQRAGAALAIRGSSANVQVALQGGEWQQAETSLKLYPGDAVSVRAGGDAVIHFFDGTNVRLDQSSELAIETSDHYDGERESQIGLTLRSGRVWISTPSPEVFSGSITRVVSTVNYKADIPGSTSVLLASSSLNVLRAGGVGIKTTLTFAKNAPELFIGEGQVFSLTDDAKQAIIAGKDPYEYRDPVTMQQLRDEFLTSSFALFSSQGTVIDTNTNQTGATVTNQDLTITSPQNQATVTTKTIAVSGKVSARVTAVVVNGQNVTVAKDGKFSIELAPLPQPTTVIHIEAQDAQGLTLAQADRTVNNNYKPVVQPVRFKSPVGSGETLKTTLREVEITGEAPQGTAAIMVNDYRLQLYKAGGKTWSYLASADLGNLIAGKNVFTVFALDADGNKSPSRSITIEFTSDGTTASGATVSSTPPLKQNPPLTPGVLIVDKPESGLSAATSEKEMVIEGRTSGDTASISINGYTLSLYIAGKTTWNYIASTEMSTMKRGRNVYRVVARNKDGEILDVLEYVITYNP